LIEQWKQALSDESSSKSTREDTALRELKTFLSTVTTLADFRDYLSPLSREEQKKFFERPSVYFSWQVPDEAVKMIEYIREITSQSDLSFTIFCRHPPFREEIFYWPHLKTCQIPLVYVPFALEMKNLASTELVIKDISEGKSCQDAIELLRGNPSGKLGPKPLDLSEVQSVGTLFDGPPKLPDSEVNKVLTAVNGLPSLTKLTLEGDVLIPERKAILQALASRLKSIEINVIRGRGRKWRDYLQVLRDIIFLSPQCTIRDVRIPIRRRLIDDDDEDDDDDDYDSGDETDLVLEMWEKLQPPSGSNARIEVIDIALEGRGFNVRAERFREVEKAAVRLLECYLNLKQFRTVLTPTTLIEKYFDRRNSPLFDYIHAHDSCPVPRFRDSQALLEGTYDSFSDDFKRSIIYAHCKKALASSSVGDAIEKYSWFLRFLEKDLGADYDQFHKEEYLVQALAEDDAFLLSLTFDLVRGHLDKLSSETMGRLLSQAMSEDAETYVQQRRKRVFPDYDSYDEELHWADKQKERNESNSDSMEEDYMYPDTDYESD